jgi:hypothetical protein
LLSSNAPSFSGAQLLGYSTCAMKFGEQLVVFQKSFQSLLGAKPSVRQFQRLPRPVGHRGLALSGDSMSIGGRDENARFLCDIASVKRQRKTRAYCDTEEKFDRQIIHAAIDEFAQGGLRHTQPPCSHHLRCTSLTDSARHLQCEVTP